MRLLVLAEDDPVSLLMKGLRERDNIELRRVSSHLDALSMAQTWHPHVVIITESLASPELVSSIRDHAPVPSYLLIKEYSPAGLTQVVRCGASSAITSETSPEDFLRLLHLDLEAWQPDSVHALSQLGSIEFVGESAVIKEVCRLIAFSAPSNASVLITGESGTGKEVVAQAIHRLSPRRDAPFVAINCCAIPENLLEAELFGHEKGAFTGAEARRQGRFELADGGTLFLDEIGELSQGMQVKLLRVLQERSFERIGSSEPIHVDLRLITATNSDLDSEIEKGHFRPDLYYRLNVLRIEVPPLRDRPDDIALLWDYFVQSWAREESRTPQGTQPRVKEFLKRQRWPGNIRELANLARRAVALRAAPMITPGALPASFLQNDLSRESEAPRLVGTSLDELEREAILRTYTSVGNVRDAADVLGISERKLYYRLKEYRDQGFLDDEDDELCPEISGGR